MTRISVIIPTLGRPTLHRTVSSVLTQLEKKDELVIVGDGPTQNVQWVREHGDLRIRYFEHGPTHSWGAAQYDFGMNVAEGTWCVFLPDDDYMPDGALETIRRGVEGTTGVHVFACRMDHWGGRVLANSKNVCEVTANQIVLPRNRSALLIGPHWADNKSQTFDHAYLTAMLTWYGQEDPIYHPEVICIADQQNNGRVF